MHFSIPLTRKEVDEAGNNYTLFDIHINGVYHCSARYSRLHAFSEELKREFPTQTLPLFPPKKLFSLSLEQLDERRAQLERFIQLCSQDGMIGHSDTFNGFFLALQQESLQADAESVSLKIYLMNGQNIGIDILSTDKTDDVLEAAAAEIGIQENNVYYFGLFLVRKETKDLLLIRKLQDFESPHISLKAANKEGVHKLVIRKAFWDPALEEELLRDRMALNMLFVQAENDIERSWVLADEDQMSQLNKLRKGNSKKEYLRYARVLRYYGFIHFKPALADYPSPGTQTFISVGHRRDSTVGELCLRIVDSSGQRKEGIFKITRMRCWRVASSPVQDANSNSSGILPGSKSNGEQQPKEQLELSFEYLVAREELQWITIKTEQAILLSMCLQSMVDELLMRKAGRKMRKPSDRGKKPSGGGDQDTSVKARAVESVKKFSDKLQRMTSGGDSSAVTSTSSSAVAENAAFGGIGDDDL